MARIKIRAVPRLRRNLTKIKRQLQTNPNHQADRAAAFGLTLLSETQIASPHHYQTDAPSSLEVESYSDESRSREPLPLDACRAGLIKGTPLQRGRIPLIIADPTRKDKVIKVLNPLEFGTLCHTGLDRTQPQCTLLRTLNSCAGQSPSPLKMSAAARAVPSAP